MSKNVNIRGGKPLTPERLESFKKTFLGMKNIPIEVIRDNEKMLKQQIREALKSGMDLSYVKEILESEDKLKDLVPDFKIDKQFFKECLEANLEFGLVDNLKFLRENNKQLFSEILQEDLVRYGEIVTNSFKFLHLPNNFDARSRYAKNDPRSSTDKEAYLKEIMPEFFVLYMAEKSGVNTYSEKVLDVFKKAIKHKDLKTCEYIAEKIHFDIFDNSIKWEKLGNPDIEKKALEKYVNSAEKQKILANKQKILQKALELDLEFIVKKLAKDELIDLSKINLTNEAKKNLQKMIKNNVITVASLSESNDNSQINENIRSFSQHQAGEKFWVDLRNLLDNYPDSVVVKKINNTPEMEFLRKVKKSLEKQSPPIFSDREIEFLSTDFVSFKKLFEAGLADSDSIKKHMNKNQNSSVDIERSDEFVEYYDKIKFSDRVVYASESANLKLLNLVEQSNPQKYEEVRNEEMGPKEEILPKAVMKLLKSGDINQIQAKIPENSLNELGLTANKLKELFEKPKNILKAVVDKIIEICGLSDLRMRSYQKQVVKLQNNSPNIRVQETKTISKAEPTSTRRLDSSIERE